MSPEKQDKTCVVQTLVSRQNEEGSSTPTKMSKINGRQIQWNVYTAKYSFFWKKDRTEIKLKVFMIMFVKTKKK